MDLTRCVPEILDQQDRTLSHASPLLSPLSQRTEHRHWFLRLEFSGASVFEPGVRDAAMAVPLMCVAFDLFAGPSKRQIVIAGAKQAPDREALVNAAYSTYDPDKIILQIDETNAQDREFWQQHNPNALAMARTSRAGEAVAYVCQTFACLAPIEDPQGLEQILRQAPSAPKVTTFKL